MTRAKCVLTVRNAMSSELELLDEELQNLVEGDLRAEYEPRPTPLTRSSLAGRDALIPFLGEQNERDLFDARPEQGHDQIESAALNNAPGLNRRLVEKIYFGNWQRDMSQVISPFFLSNYFLRTEGRKPSLSDEAIRSTAGSAWRLLYRVVKALAEYHFPKDYGQLTPQTLGTYRWEEHIDNPREYKIAIKRDESLVSTAPVYKPSTKNHSDHPNDFLHEFWAEGSVSQIANYILLSKKIAYQRLIEALRIRSQRGFKAALPVFGSAMHIVEDFYAHSNFVELAVWYFTGKNKHPHPKQVLTGTPAAKPDVVLTDLMRRPRLITGVFGPWDTLDFIQEKIVTKYLDSGNPSHSPVRQAVIRAMAEELGLKDALTAYQELLAAWQSTGIPKLTAKVIAMTGIPDVKRALEVLILDPLRRAIVQVLIRPLQEVVEKRSAQGVYPHPRLGNIAEPSHTLLSKDKFKPNGYHLIARSLASLAVKSLWNAWYQFRQQELDKLLDRYMSHPAAHDWWVATLRKRI